MKRTLTTLGMAALVFSALGSSSVWAREVGSPYEERLAKLPAPSAEMGFTYEGKLLGGGNPVGTFFLRAEPAEDAGAPVWKTYEKLSFQDGAFVVVNTAVYDAKLRPLRGVLEETKGDKKARHAWTATKTGVRIESGEIATREVPHQGTYLHDGIAPLFLFARLTKHAVGSYSSHLLMADDGKFEPCTWKTGAKGSWGTAQAKLVSGKRADGNSIAAGFDANTGDLLGFKLGEGERALEAKAVDYFEGPPRTAQQAALQCALGFATANLPLLERVVHWESIHAAALKANPDDELKDVEARKQAVLARLKEQLKPFPREFVVMGLSALRPTLKATKTEAGHLVALGPQFRNMKLTVSEFDGQWYVVKLRD